MGGSKKGIQVNQKDILIDAVVHHSIFYNWGAGTILDFRLKDNLGYRTARKVKVQWSNHPEPMWCRMSELRKTPRQ